MSSLLSKRNLVLRTPARTSSIQPISVGVRWCAQDKISFWQEAILSDFCIRFCDPKITLTSDPLGPATKHVTSDPSLLAAETAFKVMGASLPSLDSSATTNVLPNRWKECKMEVLQKQNAMLRTLQQLVALQNQLCFEY